MKLAKHLITGGRTELNRIDIANNIKSVELLKVEIMQSLTDLYGDIAAEADFDTENKIADDAANVINLVYLLCKRLGVRYSDINMYMKKKLEKGICDKHNLEKRFGDLSELLNEISAL